MQGKDGAERPSDLLQDGSRLENRHGFRSLLWLKGGKSVST